MNRGRAAIRYALVFAAGCAACEASDRNDAQSKTDAHVQAADAALDATGGRSDAGAIETDARVVGGDASSSGAKDASAAKDARADANCPPECFRAYTCAASCDAPAFDNGCCPCPAGTIDTITCTAQQGGCGSGAPGCGEEGAACCDPAPCDGPNFCHGALRCCGDSCAASCAAAGGGYCAVPCTGAAPFPSVVQACQAITDRSACQAYEADEFPHGCRWVTPGTAPCPALP